MKKTGKRPPQRAKPPQEVQIPAASSDTGRSLAANGEEGRSS